MDSFSYLFDLPDFQLKRYPQKISGGLWQPEKTIHYSSFELQQWVLKISAFIVEQQILPGSRIILLSRSYSLQWLAADLGIMRAGCITVPVHIPVQTETWELILREIEPACILVVEGNPPTQDLLHHVVKEIINQNNEISPDSLLRIGEIRKNIAPADIATIVYTSGSSGEPRAVMLSHANIVSNVLAMLTLVPFLPGTRVLSYLPLSHIFERTVCYVYIASGASIFFIESYRNILPALHGVKPEYFTTVPMLLERFVAAWEERLEEANWFTRWAYKSWEEKTPGLFGFVGRTLADLWILRNWRKKMGGKLKGIVCGAAYLDPETEKIYRKSGVVIRQGYGLTEASPVVSINRFEPGGNMRGSVGIPLPGVDVRIADDGEILVKGPNVMKGYFKRPEESAQVLQDGWLHTGDVGYFEKGRFLFITDRKSNIYKHSSGRFIAPAVIEARLTQHPLVEHAIIIGFKRPYTIAVIVPDFWALEAHCKKEKIHWTGPAYMIYNPAVREFYEKIISRIPTAPHEKIEKFILVAEPWTIENGLLSTTLKPRRKVVEQKYQKEIEDLYED